MEEEGNKKKKENDDDDDNEQRRRSSIHLRHLDSILLSTITIQKKKFTIRMNLLGCIMVVLDSTTTSSSFARLSVLTKHNATDAHDDDDYPNNLPILLIISSNVDHDAYYYFSNPNIISVVVDHNALQHWEQDETISVWMARLIAKYTEGIMTLLLLHEDQDNTTTTTTTTKPVITQTKSLMMTVPPSSRL
eukprot:scaffold2362_cov109-Cylindrotheca_fusiformis.AAC.11